MKKRENRKADKRDRKRLKRKISIARAIKDAEKRGDYEVAEHLTSKVDLG